MYSWNIFLILYLKRKINGKIVLIQTNLLNYKQFKFAIDEMK